jgi:hypothetical protein
MAGRIMNGAGPVTGNESERTMHRGHPESWCPPLEMNREDEVFFVDRGAKSVISY